MYREDAQQIFRMFVLSALDHAANEVFKDKVTMTSPGAMDKDLPTLFPAIDVQVDRLAERFGVELQELPNDD